MNPFDLIGPEFLVLYAGLAVITLAGAFFFRWYLRQPGGAASPGALDLDAYQTAYLAGGPNLVVQAAFTRLVREGHLAVAVQSRTIAAGTELSQQAHPVEQSVYQASARRSYSLHDLRSCAEDKLEILARGLEETGLSITPGQAWAARLLPALLLWGLTLFGAIKIGVGLARGRPIGFLLAGCVATFAVGLIFLCRRPWRSRRGDAALAELRRDHAALGTAARSNSDRLNGADLALALGLFGVGVLGAGALGGLRELLRPSRSSAGGSNSSSACGSGGEVGGGGCGGGGCGGGGCGGCGG